MLKQPGSEAEPSSSTDWKWQGKSEGVVICIFFACICTLLADLGNIDSKYLIQQLKELTMAKKRKVQRDSNIGFSGKESGSTKRKCAKCHYESLHIITNIIQLN
jgi:hypothetical protein